MRKLQSKRASLAEACANTAAGFIFSFIIQKALNYAYDIEMSNEVAAWFVFWFTIVSVARSYVLRRLWTNEFWKRLGRSKNPHSTKQCPQCSETNLVHLTSHNLKMCPRCGIDIPWTLDAGQDSLLTNAKGTCYGN